VAWATEQSKRADSLRIWARPHLSEQRMQKGEQSGTQLPAPKLFLALNVKHIKKFRRNSILLDCKSSHWKSIPIQHSSLSVFSEDGCELGNTAFSASSSSELQRAWEFVFLLLKNSEFRIDLQWVVKRLLHGRVVSGRMFRLLIEFVDSSVAAWIMWWK
jgi:hypothetical protein